MAFNVLLDASVLVPISLTDILLRAGEAYLYRPLWSDEILTEVRNALIGDLDLNAEAADGRIQAMRGAFEDAAVTGYEDLVPVMKVDPEDRHVAAAAVAGAAQVIVTLDLGDFPQWALNPYNIEVQSPDEFLTNLLYLDSDRMVQIIQEQAADLDDPPFAPEEICAELRLFAPGFADLLVARLSEA